MVLGSMDIGAAGAFPPKMSKTVLFGDTKVLVVRDTDGQLHAVSAICTHMGCSIRFEANRGGGLLACNCHESKFSLRGENLSGPATGPLAAYSLENSKGRLILADAQGGSKSL